jgi:hypothetical protein
MSLFDGFCFLYLSGSLDYYLYVVVVNNGVGTEADSEEKPGRVTHCHL